MATAITDNPYLNHMPNTTPCISRKYRCHDLNKPAHLRIQVKHSKGSGDGRNETNLFLVIDQSQLYLHTLHMVANVDQYTNQVSPLYPCRREKKKYIYMVQLKVLAE